MVLLLPNAQSTSDNAAKVSTSVLINTLCMSPWLREANRQQASGWATSLRSQQTLPPANCIWSLVLSSPFDHSAIKFFAFWCNMNWNAHTDQAHIDWHSAAIFKCKKNGDQTEFGSLLIPQIEQHRGVERKHNVQLLLYESHIYYVDNFVVLSFPSFIHISFLCAVRLSDICLMKVLWVFICNQKIDEFFHVVKCPWSLLCTPHCKNP